MEWLKKIAPTLASALIGPAAGTAVALLGELFGISEPTVETVTKAIADSNIPHDKLVAIREIEAKLKAQEAELGFKYAELEYKTQQLYVEDTEAARRAHAQNESVFKLGVATILAFAVTMALLLVGCYMVLTKGIEMKDPGTVAVVFSLVGTIVGYMASNAQQVYNYFFGSSRGSADKTNALSAAVTKLQSVIDKK